MSVGIIFVCNCLVWFRDVDVSGFSLEGILAALCVRMWLGWG